MPLVDSVSPVKMGHVLRLLLAAEAGLTEKPFGVIIFSAPGFTASGRWPVARTISRVAITFVSAMLASVYQLATTKMSLSGNV